jgi:hypothetical protein
MIEKHIPASRIALNPVVVDDSKRGEPTRCPLDEHALLARLAVIRSRPASQPKKTWETCNQHFTCPNGEECWYLSEDFHNEENAGIHNKDPVPEDFVKIWNEYIGKRDLKIRNQTLDDVVSGIQGLNRTKPYLNSNDKFAMNGRMEVMSLVESLRTWKAHPVKKRKEMEFLEDVVR